MNKLLLLLPLACVLAACEPNLAQKVDPDTGIAWESRKLVTLPNGCEVHGLKVDGSYIHMAYCPVGPASLYYTCGSSSCSSGSMVKQSEKEIAKAAALAKLTPAERKLLELKE